MSRNNRPSGSVADHAWRDLYKAALFETDEEKTLARVAEAERALIVRARELFAMGDKNDEEGEAIDDALYALQALRHCTELKTREMTAA